MKAILAGVYRKSTLCDCSFGGVSSKYDEVLVPCADGFVDVDESKPLPPNLVEVCYREFYGNQIPYITPYGAKASGRNLMFGGTFIFTSDSRFAEIVDNGGWPVPFHDRIENV